MSTELKGTVIKKAPPKHQPRGFLKPKPKSALREQVEALSAGDCLELRGLTKMTQKHVYGVAHNVRKKLGKKLTVRTIGETGVDVYCIG